MAGLLRIATAGSVDDGKSTLIGRLLYDSKSVLADQLEAVERTSRDRGADGTDLSLLTDGLRAEREQGITIDVAYRYFQTARRSFVLADTPGHVQYTRNMVTGASTADLAIVLVDARKGLLEQSRRHAVLAALLRVPHVVLAVNKMDLVGFDEAVFRGIEADFRAYLDRLGLAVPDVAAIPVSALQGDNVVHRSDATPWYPGEAMLRHLEDVRLVTRDREAEGLRFPVQYVIRPQTDTHRDYRGYAGRVVAGLLRPGDEVVVLPSGQRTTVRAVDTIAGELEVAYPPMSVTVRLVDDLDVSRGDVLATPDRAPAVVRELAATVCWMTDAPLVPGARVSVKSGTRTVRAAVDAVESVLDVTSLEETPTDGLRLNDIGRVRLRLAQPLVVDDYTDNRGTGSFIVIDEATGTTAGAGLVRHCAVAEV